MRALTQKKELSIEHRVAHPDGAVLWLHSRGRIIYDETGRPVRGIGICIDITERKHREERLAKLNECLLTLGENPEENIKRLTALCEETLGGERVLYHRLDGESPPMVFGKLDMPGEGAEKGPSEMSGSVTPGEGSASAPASHDASRAPAKRAAPRVGGFAVSQAKPRMDVGVQCRGKHVGLLHAVWEKDSVPTDEDKKFLEAIALAIGTEEIRREETETRALREKERAQQEEELRAREKRYRELLENANSIILRMDTKGQITYFNEFAQKFFGYTPDEVLGKSVVGTIVPKAGAADRDLEFMIKNICKYPEQYATNQNENVKKGGERVLIAWTNKAILDEGGKIAEILCIGNDITEFQRLQEQLLQSKKMEAIGRLAGGVAHDFSSLLATIANHASKAKGAAPPDSPMHEDIEEILKNAEGASHFSRQLLAFSRQFLAFSKRQAIELKTVDLNELIRTIEEALRRLLHKGIELVTTFAPGLGLVRADPGQLSEVIINLVANACDAMPRGGTLSIETANVTLDEKYVRTHAYATPGEFVKLTVSDTGIGMTEEVKAHLFEPFFTTKGVGKGSGLGLSTAYGIVKQYGGYIDVSTEVGRGTVFTIYLPRAKE
jgi:PAS domain S-box-containing protein